MIPEPCEYITLVALYAVLIFSLFFSEAARLVSSSRFWTSAAIFATIWTCFDILGIRAEMWRFSPERTLGLQLFQVPVEELLVFLLIQISAIASWKTFQRNAKGG